MLAPRGGRPDPESSKAIETYNYSQNHTNSPYVCPRMHEDCPYEGWVFCATGTSGTFLQVGGGPITAKLLPYPEL